MDSSKLLCGSGGQWGIWEVDERGGHLWAGSRRFLQLQTCSVLKFFWGSKESGNGILSSGEIPKVQKFACECVCLCISGDPSSALDQILHEAGTASDMKRLVLIWRTWQGTSTFGNACSEASLICPSFLPLALVTVSDRARPLNHWQHWWYPCAWHWHQRNSITPGVVEHSLRVLHTPKGSSRASAEIDVGDFLFRPSLPLVTEQWHGLKFLI